MRVREIAQLRALAAFLCFLFLRLNELNEIAIGSHLFRYLLAQKAGRLEDH